MSSQNLSNTPTLDPRLTGVIAPMLTPCLEDSSIDFDGCRSMVRWLKSRKVVSSIFARSGVGGMWSFTMDETRRFVETVVDEAAGEIGVLANCSGEFDGDSGHRPDPQRYLDQSIELAAFARDKGADVAVLVIPYVLAPPKGKTIEDLIFEYYEAVAGAVEIPIFIYQAPGVPPEYRASASLMRRLVGLPQICGIKVSTNQHEVFDPVAEGVKEAPRFALIAGSEYFYLEALKLGAVGVIGGGLSTQPELVYALKWHFDRGNMERAEDMQLEVIACEKALSAMGPFSRSLAMMVIARQGYPMSHYTRRGVYSRSRGRRLPKRIDVFADAAQRLIEAFVTPYREAIEAGGELP